VNRRRTLSRSEQREDQNHGQGSIVVISAPSGTGKSTVVRHLLSSMPSLRFSISYTTRRPRAWEKNGREYFFVSPARFKEMVAAGEFVEWARVYGNLYGTSRLQLQQTRQKGKDILLDIDVQGHREVRRRLPEAISIFLLPPSYEELKNRLVDRRSDSAPAIQKRLSAAREEIGHWPEYDYIVVNDEADKAGRALRDIIKAARFHRKSRRKEIQQICKTFGG
jgi:guanylate kinase